MPSPFSRLFPLLLVCLLPVSTASAQQAPRPALPPETPPAIQQNMEVIQRYSDEVTRRTQNTPPVAAPKANGGQTPAPVSTPTGSAPTRVPNAPLVAATLERDPFEVSPQLREGNRRMRGGGIGSTPEGVVLSRSLHLKAIARGPSGGVAQIQSGRDVLTVRDGDELDVDGMRYTVHVEQDGLVLRGAGAPQFKLLVR